MTPTQIKLSNPSELSVKWDDGHASIITLRTLRDNCPCAGCKGETVILKSYIPQQAPELPGKYALKNAEQVGYYALQLYWGDGHSTGMFTWEHLRSLCECPECAARES